MEENDPVIRIRNSHASLLHHLANERVPSKQGSKIEFTNELTARRSLHQYAVPRSLIAKERFRCPPARLKQDRGYAIVTWAGDRRFVRQSTLRRRLSGLGPPEDEIWLRDFDFGGIEGGGWEWDGGKGRSEWGEGKTGGSQAATLGLCLIACLPFLSLWLSS
jgi:hypothetical protein